MINILCSFSHLLFNYQCVWFDGERLRTTEYTFIKGVTLKQQDMLLNSLKNKTKMRMIQVGLVQVK